jgi:phosphatidate cytidylyltransferase
MGSFSYLYYETFVSTHNVNVGNVLQSIIVNLEPQDIIVLVKSLVTYLFKLGVINEDALQKITAAL